MKQPSTLNPILLLGVLLMTSSILLSQAPSNLYRIVENRLTVDASPEHAWKVLSDFSGVSDYHALFDESNLLKGKEGSVEVGSERESHIPDGINNVILKERITNMLEGSFYSYTVFDWENIPLEGMSVTYGVGINELGQTEIYNRTAYCMTSGVVTSLTRGKFERGSRDSLISFKYYIETGQSEKDLKKLRKWYKKKKKEPEVEDFIVNNYRPIE